MIDGFDAIYQAKHGAIYRHCLQLLGNPEDAAEATQEVFSTFLHASAIDNPGAWLHRVAHNHCMNRLRTRRREAGGGAEAPSGAGTDPERQALARVALSSAFAALTPKERRALAGSTIQDRTVGSVAREMGMSYFAAAQLLSRARRRAAAAAASIVGLMVAAVSRRTPRGAVGHGVLPPVSQNLAVAVAAIIVAGTAAVHFSGSGTTPPSAHGTAPLQVVVPAASASPPPSVVRRTSAAAPSSGGNGAVSSGAHAAVSSRPAATAVATPAPSGTPPPVVVSAGPYQCDPDPSQPLGSLACAPH